MSIRNLVTSIGLIFALIVVWISLSSSDRPSTEFPVDSEITELVGALGGNDFGLKPHDLVIVENPEGEGYFAYFEETRYRGTERFFIWFLNSGRASPLNGPSKTATPELPFPRDLNASFLEGTGFDAMGVTRFGIDLVFR